MWLPKCGNHGSNIATLLLLPSHHHHHRRCNPSITTIERLPQHNDDMTAARSCPPQVSNTTPLPASSLTPTKGAMSQLAMWQPDDDATTVTHTTWQHDMTTTAMLPHVYASPEDSPPPTNGSPPPHPAVAHEQRWMPPNKDDRPPTKATTHAHERKQLPTNMNGCGERCADHRQHVRTWATTCRHGQQCTDMGNNAQTWATTHRHGQQCMDMGNDARMWATMRRHGQQCADTGHNTWTRETMSEHGQRRGDTGNDKPR